MLYFLIGGVKVKESKIIIIVSILSLCIIIISTLILEFYFSGIYDFTNIAINLSCGIIVGLVTAICQYWFAKRKIINTVYKTYFDIYRTYYYAKNNPTLFHYSSRNVYKKIVESGSIISESIGEYCGFIKKHDKTYKKINPNIVLNSEFNKKNIIKSVFKCFNKKYFDIVIVPLISEIENILSNINKKRFENDKEAMKKMFKILGG